jgi:hypothetical protein
MAVMPTPGTPPSGGNTPEALCGDPGLCTCTQAQLRQPGEPAAAQIVRVERQRPPVDDAWRTYRNDCF